MSDGSSAESFADPSSVDPNMDYSALSVGPGRRIAADRIEQLVCVLFLCICHVFPMVMPLHERIPSSQTINENGELIWNLSNQEPLEGTTVSTQWLLVLTVVAPLLLQLALAHRFSADGGGGVHRTICTFCVAVGLTSLVTGVIKQYCGYLRPVYGVLCDNGDGDTIDDCSDHNAHRSFPSGHASTAFCGMTLLTLFLHKQFGAGHSNMSTPRQRCISILVALLPMGVATWIAASRVVDNWHFPADVVGGAVLGSSVANYVHSVWW